MWSRHCVHRPWINPWQPQQLLCFCCNALCKVPIQIYNFLIDMPFTRGKLSCPFKSEAHSLVYKSVVLMIYWVQPSEFITYGATQAHKLVIFVISHLLLSFVASSFSGLWRHPKPAGHRACSTRLPSSWSTNLSHLASAVLNWVSNHHQMDEGCCIGGKQVPVKLGRGEIWLKTFSTFSYIKILRR